MFFYFLTGGKSPLPITITYYEDQSKKYIVDLKNLSDFQKDTKSILFIDLIKEMLHESPDNRLTCQQLNDHIVFKEMQNWVEIVKNRAADFFYENHVNKERIKIMNMKKLHMIGFLNAECEKLTDFLLEINHDSQPNINDCSSLLKMFTLEVITYSV